MRDGRVAVATADSSGAGRWFRRAVMPRASVRLFCLPHAGGSASLYRNWHDWLAPDIEVVAVEPPGRGIHVRGVPPESLDDLVERLLAALASLFDLPYAFLGHSLGALVAFEMSRRLQERGGPQPEHLFVSGLGAPHLAGAAPALHALDDDALLAALGRLGGVPRDVLREREWMDLFVPLVRADLRLGASYRCPAGTRLRHPLTVFAGLRDAATPRADLEAWQQLCEPPCCVRHVPGGHFFIQENGHLVAASVHDSLIDVGWHGTARAVPA